MALLCPNRTEVRGTTTRATQRLPAEKPPETTRRDLEWPGRQAFAELGELLSTFEIQGQVTTITAGMFRDDEASYFASYRPYALGAAVTWKDAIQAWLKELNSARQAAKQLGQNVGAATAKDVQSLRDFFGSL